MFNSNSQIDVTKVGQQQTPVITIDNFFNHLPTLIEGWLKSSSFVHIRNSFYPGVRAGVPEELANKIVSHVETVIKQTYCIDKQLKAFPYEGVLSLVTKPPQELIPPQRIPHIDTYSNTGFAVLIYLNPGDFGGTGLFRHKPTQFERIDENNVSEYHAVLNEFIEQNGMPEAKYINDSDEHFELFHRIDYRANRLVIYPVNVLHSGMINERNLHTDPSKGRLTLNIFVEFK